MNSKSIPTICFIGLPSAGKSSIINSLIGKHILKTGVYRTTKMAYFIGKNNEWNVSEEQYRKKLIVSDDGWEFNIVDLPGVADSENINTETNFNDLTNEWILKCDIIYWVSDIKTAFMTTYEKQEFEKVQQILITESERTAKLYNLKIMLSKYEIDDEPSNGDSIYENDEDELSDKEEDTTLKDCYNRISNMFPNVSIDKFNAFGRIYHREDISPKLKKFIKASNNISDQNIEFNIDTECNGRNFKQQNLYLEKFRQLVSQIDYLQESLILELFNKIVDSRKLLEMFNAIVYSKIPISLISRVSLNVFNKFASLNEIRNLPNNKGLNYALLTYMYDLIAMSVADFEKSEYIGTQKENKDSLSSDELHICSVQSFLKGMDSTCSFETALNCIKSDHGEKSLLFKKLVVLSKYVNEINTTNTINKKWQNQIMEIRSIIWGNQNNVDINELLFHVRVGHLHNIFSEVV